MKRVNVAVAASSATKLGLFVNRELELSEAHYDALCDELLDLLERGNNERFRLRDRIDPEEVAETTIAGQRE